MKTAIISTRFTTRVAAVLAVALAAATSGEAASAYMESLVTTGAVMGQPAKTSTQKMWIADEKVRVEQGDDTQYTILRKDKGLVYLVDPKAKTYVEMSLEQMKAMAQMGMAMMGQKGELKVDLKKTEETAKVGEWTATKAILTIAGGAMQTEMNIWVSKDVQLDMKAWSDLAEGMGMRGLVGDAADKMAALDGYPVKHESTVTMMGMKVTTSSELKVFKPGAVEDARFEVPPGYTKTEGFKGMPAGVGAGAGAK